MVTALHAAVESDDLEEVRRLLKADKANDLLNAQDLKTKETPLHLAARLGNENIVKALLEAGVDLKIRVCIFCESCEYFYHSRCFDAYHIAAAFGHVSVMEVLLAAAGPQSLEDPWYGDFLSLDLAAALGHLEALNFLLAHRPVAASFKNRAFCFALYYGQIEAVRSLILSGADVNETSVIIFNRDNHPLRFALASPTPLPDLQ